jgi:hypothetical protein
VKSAHAVCFLETLPSGPRHLMNPTYQPHSFTGGKPLRIDPLPCPLPPIPVRFLCCDTTGHCWPNSHRWAVHPSPPRATRMTTCPPATLSYCVGCGAPWRPVTAARLRLFFAALPAGEILATPHAKVLHPSLCELTSYPFACRLAYESLASRIVAEVSHRPAASLDRCQGRCATTMLATRPHTAPLLPPSLLTPRAARLASSSLAPRHVGTMHMHAHARRVARASTLHVQLTTPTPAYRQNSHPRVPFTAPIATLTALCHHIELSHHLPLSLRRPALLLCDTQL